MPGLIHLAASDFESDPAQLTARAAQQATKSIPIVTRDLGYFDHETCRLEPLDNPFGPKVLGPVFS
jgi:hypothetical protein